MKGAFLMRNRIMYVSKKEQTKKVAEAMGTGAKITSDPLEKHTAVTNVGILFLGCGMSFGKISGKMRKFAAHKISADQVRLVVVFSTSPKPSDAALHQIKAILEPKGIKVHDEGFFCKASSIGNKFPNADDLKNAEKFAKRICEIRVKD